ncbi:hypothetical protein CRUP_016318, partial [Coryphaenoides rupestris]
MENVLPRHGERVPKTWRREDHTGKRSTMPDSPADVKTQSRLTPPTMPPPPSTQGAPRNSSYTPTTLTNGSSHSPTALNGAPSPPNGYSNGPSSSSSSSLANQQLPPACGARQLSKLKRFLTTLQQFGNDISPEIGERVRTLVLGLVRYDTLQQNTLFIPKGRKPGLMVSRVHNHTSSRRPE